MSYLWISLPPPGESGQGKKEEKKQRKLGFKGNIQWCWDTETKVGIKWAMLCWRYAACCWPFGWVCETWTLTHRTLFPPQELRGAQQLTSLLYKMVSFFLTVVLKWQRDIKPAQVVRHLWTWLKKRSQAQSDSVLSGTDTFENWDKSIFSLLCLHKML